MELFELQRKLSNNIVLPICSKKDTNLTEVSLSGLKLNVF